MDISKLFIGLVIMNYRELCVLLNIKETGGTAKKAQLKEMERYFNYTKNGNKFIITEIYDKPLEKTDKRNDTIYGQYIEKLILDLLVNQENENNKYTLNFSANKLFEYLNMINKNYSYCLENKQKLAVYLEMDKAYIKDFYNNTYSKLTATLEGALKRLSNKMLIFWSKVITVSRYENIVENGIVTSRIEVHNIASNSEANYIIQIEKQVSELMGCKTKREIILMDKLKEFNKNVIALIKENDSDFNYYYRSYNINFNNYVQKEQKQLEMILSNNERTKLKIGLNDTLVDNYKQSNETRYQYHLDNKKYIGKSPYKSEQIKVSANYIKNDNTLVDTVINYKTKDITDNIEIKYNELKKKEAKIIQELCVLL